MTKGFGYTKQTTCRRSAEANLLLDKGLRQSASATNSDYCATKASPYQVSGVGHRERTNASWKLTPRGVSFQLADSHCLATVAETRKPLAFKALNTKLDSLADGYLLSHLKPSIAAVTRGLAR